MEVLRKGKTFPQVRRHSRRSSLTTIQGGQAVSLKRAGNLTLAS